MKLPSGSAKKTYRIIRLVLLTGAILSLSVVGWYDQPTTVAYARSSEEITSEINQLNEQVRALDEKISELQRQIDERESKIKTLGNEVAILSTEIDKLNIEIEDTQTRITLTNAEIERTEIDIQVKEKQIQKTKLGLAEYIRLMHEIDEVNPFEIIISGKNFSDILNELQYTETIQQKTQESLNTVQQLKIELEQKQNELEQQRTAALELRSQLEGQNQALQAKRSEKDELIKKTKNEEANYKKLLAQTEELQKQAVADIRNLEEELAASGGGGGASVPAGKGVLLMPANGTIVQGYGMTDFAKQGAYAGAIHNGVDIAASLGTPIHAAADGIVAATGSLGGVAYGEWVAMKHPTLNLYTLYGHLISSHEVSAGESYARGATIAHMGSTGYSTGPHVHFMVCLDFHTVQKSYGLLPYCNHVNPMSYL